MDFVLSPAGPAELRRLGLSPGQRGRSFEKNKAKFAEPAKVVTIKELGGWKKINEELFDPESGSIAKIEEDAGVSTAK